MSKEKDAGKNTDTAPAPFAVLKTGGKQFTVKVGERVRIPSIEAEEGSSVDFNEVLLKSDGASDVAVGSPTVSGASVSAKVLRQGKDDKIIVFKKKRRKGYKKKQGHRQGFTEIQIENIG